MSTVQRKGNQQGESKPSLGNFDSVEQQESWHRWQSAGQDILRKALRGDDEQARRISFKHRTEGPEPLDGSMVEAKINRACRKRDELCQILGRRDKECLDGLYNRLIRRENIAKAVIAMSNLGVYRHWDPRQSDGFAPKYHPRRTLSEADHDQRAKEADELVKELF